MREKEEIKIRLSTAISMFIIFILIVALGLMYYFGFVANKHENIGKESSTNTNVANTVENVITNVVNEDKIENKNVIENNEVKEENTIENNKSSIKLDETKCKKNFEKYLKISAVFDSNSIDILRELEFVDEYPNADDYEGVEFKDTKYSDMNYFLKTNIKYSTYKAKMLEYMTEECFKKEFSNYTRNENGYLYVVSYGGTSFFTTIQKMEKSSSNVYKIKIISKADDDGTKTTFNYVVTFDNNCRVKSVKVK